MDIIIRNVTMEDLDRVTEVEAMCFPVGEAASRAEFRERIEIFPDCFFVAEKEGQIIGFINGCATDQRRIQDEMYHNMTLHKADGRYQSIFGLDVIPEYQKQGIAALLMNHLIADAKDRGRQGVILSCKDRLLPYYTRFGYVNLGLSASVHGGAVWYDMILETK